MQTRILTDKLSVSSKLRRGNPGVQAGEEAAPLSEIGCTRL
jgi:hypothetical protein